jgi:hypothetical protein
MIKQIIQKLAEQEIRNRAVRNGRARRMATLKQRVEWLEKEHGQVLELVKRVKSLEARSSKPSTKRSKKAGKHNPKCQGCVVCSTNGEV